MNTWFRKEDAVLLRRLEDEELVVRLFRHHAGVSARQLSPHPRAAGLVATLRRIPDGRAAVDAAEHGELVSLVRFVDTATRSGTGPVLLHHLAVYFERVAEVLADVAPTAAANAWMRSLAAWLALADERSYLTHLEHAILENERDRAAAAIAPSDVALARVSNLGRRARAASRDLGPSGHAAVLSMAWVPEAARIAQVSEELAQRVAREAERLKNEAIDDALSVVAESLDEANVRGEMTSKGAAIMARVIDVWEWSGHDASVEHFAVDKLGTIGWELYRARESAGLRALLDPFRALFDRLATRIERENESFAYAAPCAQMFVFLSDVETTVETKKERLERALRVCPGHRNARVVLAAILCAEASASLRAMTVVVRKEELARVEALVERVEALYPRHDELEETKKLLERVKKVRLTL